VSWSVSRSEGSSSRVGWSSGGSYTAGSRVSWSSGGSYTVGRSMSRGSALSSVEIVGIGMDRGHSERDEQSYKQSETKHCRGRHFYSFNVYLQRLLISDVSIYICSILCGAGRLLED